KIKNIEMAGKTGTVQNPHGENHAVFFAFAPRENPKIAIAVFVENAGYGGVWAAPIASMMVEQYLTDTITLPKYIQDRIYNGSLLPKTKSNKPKLNISKQEKIQEKIDTNKSASTDAPKKALTLKIDNTILKRNDEYAS